MPILKYNEYYEIKVTEEKAARFVKYGYATYNEEQGKYIIKPSIMENPSSALTK